MSLIKNLMFFPVFLTILHQTVGLLELPPVDENDIIKVEAAIRSTTNKIFAALKIKGTKDKPSIQEYALVHNYFVSLTLQDYKTLKQIAQLTRVNDKIDNSTQHFTALLNEILVEDSQETTKSQLSDNSVANYIDENVKKIEYLKTLYENPRTNLLNADIIKLLKEDLKNNNITNIVKKDDGVILDTTEFWVPEPINGRRIFRGKNTKIKYFPFMASVHIFRKFQCSGSIIKSDLVITAASCLQLAWNNRFYREKPAFLSVRVGSNFYEAGGEGIAVLEVYFHPNYNPKNLRNNLAVMRLVRALKLTRRKVKKIDFDRGEHRLPMSTDGITVLGWGAKGPGNIVHSPWENRLSYATLDIYPLDDCQDIYSKEYVTIKNFCAGFLSKGGGACNRDVGGPGIVGGLLMGVISFGSPVCGTPDAPTVFTKLGFYTDWIEDIMGQDVPQTKKRTTMKPVYPIYTESYTQTSTTTFKMEPLVGKTLKPIPINKRQELLHPEKQLFTDFLKTVFDSKEIEQYADFLEERPIEHEIPEAVTNTPSTFQPHEFATNIVDMDPLSLDESEEDTTVKKHYDNKEKDIEKDIVVLTDDDKFTNKYSFVDLDNEKTKTQQSNGDIGKNDTDDVMTLLYLSENEKANPNFQIPRIDNVKVVKKKNSSDKKGIPTKVKYGETNFNIELTSDYDEESDDESGIDIADNPSGKFKDFTYRNNGTIQNKHISDLLTKDILYDILSEARW